MRTSEHFKSYNIAAIDFTPAEISREIQKHLPDFKINYLPDFRQEIAESWPQSIDDSCAKKDWKWQHKIDLPNMTKIMLEHLM